MAEKQITGAALADTTVNCCNGRVGKRLLELAQENEAIRQLVAPTGVELIRQAAQAGRALGETVNCCNGRVGSALNIKDLATELGGAGE
jgi:hypothetical protein